MSLPGACPFGCTSLQHELLVFKQVAMNYFDKILTKFNEQDNSIKELTKRIDQSLNLNYENIYQDQSHCQEEIIASCDSGHPAMTLITKQELPNDNESDQVAYFVTDDPETQANYSAESQAPVVEDRYPVFATDMVVKEESVEPTEAEHLMPAIAMEPELVVEVYDSSLTAECLSQPSTSATIRASENDSRLQKLKQALKNADCPPVVSKMTSFQIRARFSKTVINNDGTDTIQCNLCEKQFHSNRSPSSIRSSNFAEHVRMVHLGRKFQCLICNALLCTKSMFAKHLQKTHSVSALQASRYLRVLFRDVNL